MKNRGEGVIIVNQMSGSTATPGCALHYLWWDSQPPLHRMRILHAMNPAVSDPSHCYRPQVRDSRSIDHTSQRSN